MKLNETKVAKIVRADGTERTSSEIPEQGKSLADLRPDIAEELIGFEDPKDRNLTAWDVKRGQDKRAIFRCKTCGHVWTTTIKARTVKKKNGVNGTKCPECKKKYQTSYQEQYVKNVLKYVFPDLEEQVKIPGTRMSFDIVIPSRNLVIEYGQQYMHDENRNTDARKVQYCKQNNITILFIIQDKNVGKKQQGYYGNGVFKIANRNKVSAKPLIDPVLDVICKCYRVYDKLKEVDRMQCQHIALANQR